MPMTVAQGKRSSASRSYLRPVKDRRNLQVLTQAHVQRIEMRGNQAICVEVMLKGQIERLTAAKEILLCAGAINSPQLLM